MHRRPREPRVRCTLPGRLHGQHGSARCCASVGRDTWRFMLPATSSLATDAARSWHCPHLPTSMPLTLLPPSLTPVWRTVVIPQSVPPRHALPGHRGLERTFSNGLTTSTVRWMAALPENARLAPRERTIRRSVIEVGCVTEARFVARNARWRAPGESGTGTDQPDEIGCIQSNLS